MNNFAQISALAQKLVISFFKANPTTTLTQSEVQKNCRKQAEAQINATPATLAALETIAQFTAWFATNGLQNKANGGAVVSFREIPSSKPQNMGRCLRLTLSNGKTSDCAVPFLARFFFQTAK